MEGGYDAPVRNGPEARRRHSELGWACCAGFPFEDFSKGRFELAPESGVVFAVLAVELGNFLLVCSGVGVRRFVTEVELDGHTTENWALVLEIGPHVDGRNGELTRHLDSAKREG